MRPQKQNRENAHTLRRGLACLSCRKRKLKCDGSRPTCHQCIKMNRAEQCSYDDSRRKSRTEKLREKLLMLEEKVRELESDSASNPGSSSLSVSPASSVPPDDMPIHLFVSPNPNQMDHMGWMSNEGVSPPSDLYPSCFPDPGSPPKSSYQCDQAIFSPNPPDPTSHLKLSTSLLTTDWKPGLPLPYETHKYLLETFALHRKQCYFYSDIHRFTNPDLPENPTPETPPHPALTNAIYLLACYFGRSELTARLEPTFLTHTLHQITLALHTSHQLTDAIQASCLLALYYYFNNRVLEGYRHAFSAARLAVGLGLHQLQLPQIGSRSPSPVQWTTIGHKVATFWQVFMVDRSWTTVNGLVSGLPDPSSSAMRITTPLPLLLGGFESEFMVLQSPMHKFFEAESHMSDLDTASLSTSALKVIATSLYYRTSKLTKTHEEIAGLLTDRNSCEAGLPRIMSMVPPFPGAEIWKTQAPYVDTELFAVHTLLYMCVLYLRHGEAIDANTTWAANSMIELISQLCDDDYQFLDPNLSFCWARVAHILVEQLKLTERTSISDGTTIDVTSSFVYHCVNVLVKAAKKLNDSLSTKHHCQALTNSPRTVKYIPSTPKFEPVFPWKI